jgi:amidohydrolase
MSIDWMQLAQQRRDTLIARRRDFHQHPELAFQEVRTAGIVAQVLQDLGLEVQRGVGQTGVVAILEGTTDGPTILVRADMDALPVHEETNAPYQSLEAGKMHACGHDGHVAIALAVAEMLAEQKDRVKGRIKFVFQPAEEIASGAQAMIADGVLAQPAPDVTLGLHLWNEIPVGTVSVTEGSAMAGAADWQMTVRGSGSHGAMPHLGRDPIVAASQIVSALQAVVSRNVSPLDTAVLSCTMFHAGTARNVIPNEAVLAGTYRTYRPEVRDLVDQRLRETALAVAQAFGCTVEIQTRELTPPLINDAQTNRRLRATFNALETDLTFVNDVRTMAAEDFAVFMTQVHGSYFFVGSAKTGGVPSFPHHHPKFDIDEDSLAIGAGLLAAAVADYVLVK